MKIKIYNLEYIILIYINFLQLFKLKGHNQCYKIYHEFEIKINYILVCRMCKYALN